MNLVELKRKSINDLVDLATDSGVDGIGSMRKQDLIFAIIQAEAASDGDLFSEGVLEKMPDGYGFLRSPDSSYLPGPDDVYVSPSQIRRLACRPGIR